MVSSYSFDVNLEEIHDKSLPLILTIEKILEDFNSKQSDSLFISEQTTLHSNNGLQPNELLNELIQFMSNQTMISFVIDSVENTSKKFYNHLLIIDTYESFR